jgi:hypothetical protein
MEKPKNGRLLILLAVVVGLGGVAALVWKNTDTDTSAKPVIVKPDNPNDPKYQPKVPGLAGAGAGQ